MVSGGRMIRNACGTTIDTMARACEKPSERAASNCPLGTAWMPARIVSAMYAADTRPSARATLPYVPPTISVPGKASGTATPTKMKISRAGRPRKISM